MSRIDKETALAQRIASAIRTLGLLAIVFVIFMAVASLFFSPAESLFFVILAVATVTIGSRFQQRALLLAQGARPLAPHMVPTIHRMVAVLSQRASLPKTPQLYLLDSHRPNAFATGTRSASSICLSRGLLTMLNEREIAGVLAHEIGHIRNGDSFSLGLAAGLGRMAASFSWLGFAFIFLSIPAYLAYRYNPPFIAIALLVLAPTLISILQLALSRSREFAADLEAAQLLGDPRPLASALSKLEQAERSFLRQLFVSYRPRSQDYWLSSHPPTEERIRRLLALDPHSYSHSFPDWIQSQKPRHYELPSRPSFALRLLP